MGAVWLIAVYCTAGLLVLWLANRFLVPISKPLGAALLLLPLLMTGRAVLTGGFYGPLNISYASAPLSARAGELGVRDYRDFGNAGLSDVAIQNVPWRKAVRESVANGHLPLWNRFMLSGDVLLATFQPAIFHPNTWIGLLLPLPTAWTFSCAFTLFLAALAAFLYLRDLGLPEGASLFGASVWMLSNALIILLGWAHAAVFSLLPFLAFGLRRLALGAARGFAISVTALILMVAGGHSEMLLYSVAAAGVLFLFDLCASPRPFRAVLRSLAAGVLALALTAPSMLPFLEALPQTSEKAYREAIFARSKKSVPMATSAATSFALIYPRAYGDVPAGGRKQPFSFGGVSYGYVGLLPLALGALGLASRRREKWGLLASGLLALLVAVGFPGVTDLITRLPLFDIGLNEYLICVAAFRVAALSAIGLDAAQRGDTGRWALPALAGGLCLVLLSGFEWRGRLLAEGIRPLVHDGAIARAAAGILPIAILLALPGLRRRWLVPAGLVLFLVVRLAEVPDLYPTFPSRLFYPPVPEIERLPSGPEPYRTVGVGYALVPNQSALYELEDPRGYQAMTNLRYLETYPLWSIHQPVWFNRVDDPTAPFLSFLNVRFAVAEPGNPVPEGWREFARGRHCAIFENPAALPRAFVPERIRFVKDGETTVEEMKAFRDFSKLGWVETADKPATEVRNGTATVQVRSDGRGYTVDVEAAESSWIIASVTAWKGWKAYVGGRRLPVHFANHAFLGFRVPSGSHRVRLIYWPDSFILGLVISGLSILGVAAYSLRRRARRPAWPLYGRTGRTVAYH